ncbi:hypothetical protein V9T40_006939 [Parthenolecanium corni]|uniref:Uncharacterized protein n=1 Tax=Parthenolecanium corni TaxID=536013 RepID=A0AAN9TVH9_9HEMI
MPLRNKISGITATESRIAHIEAGNHEIVFSVVYEPTTTFLGSLTVDIFIKAFEQLSVATWYRLHSTFVSRIVQSSTSCFLVRPLYTFQFIPQLITDGLGRLLNKFRCWCKKHEQAHTTSRSQQRQQQQLFDRTTKVEAMSAAVTATTTTTTTRSLIQSNIQNVIFMSRDLPQVKCQQMRVQSLRELLKYEICDAAPEAVPPIASLRIDIIIPNRNGNPTESKQYILIYLFQNLVLFVKKERASDAMKVEIKVGIESL